MAVAVEFEPEPEPAVEELMMLELPVPMGTERVADWLSDVELLELLAEGKGAREASWRR